MVTIPIVIIIQNNFVYYGDYSYLCKIKHVPDTGRRQRTRRIDRRHAPFAISALYLLKS